MDPVGWPESTSFEDLTLSLAVGSEETTDPLYLKNIVSMPHVQSLKGCVEQWLGQVSNKGIRKKKIIKGPYKKYMEHKPCVDKYSSGF